MTNPTLVKDELLPLDQVRNAEAEVTRKIAAARKEHEHILDNAKAQVRELIEEAKNKGRREGQNQYQEIVFEAEEEAKAILAYANYRAKELRRHGRRHMELAVRQVVNIIIGMENGGADL